MEISVVLIVAVFMYFLPSVVAVVNGTKNGGSAIVINVFFGWTILGWVIALAIACGEGRPKKAKTPKHDVTVTMPGHEPPLPPNNASGF